MLPTVLQVCVLSRLKLGKLLLHRSSLLLEKQLSDQAVKVKILELRCFIDDSRRIVVNAILPKASDNTPISRVLQSNHC